MKNFQNNGLILFEEQKETDAPLEIHPPTLLQLT